jgi:hypothetical protein
MTSDKDRMEAIIRALADRVVAQSEILARRADKDTDVGVPTSVHRAAGLAVERWQQTRKAKFDSGECQGGECLCATCVILRMADWILGQKP